MVCTEDFEFRQPIRVTIDQLPAPYDEQLQSDTPFYSQCIYGDLQLNVGAYVRINRVQRAAPRSVVLAGARYGRIVYLYVDTRRDPKDVQRKRAIVEYFMRPQDIAEIEIEPQSPQIHFDNEHELILDHRKAQPYKDVALESIVAPFTCYSATNADAMISIQATDMYVCRYKIIKMNGKYCLFPWAVAAAISTTRKTTTTAASTSQFTTVDAAVHNKENHCKQPVRGSPGKRKASIPVTPSSQVHQSVTPIKIVNNSVQKVRPSRRSVATVERQPQHDFHTAANNDHDDDDHLIDFSDDGNTSEDIDGETTPHKRRREQLNNNYITAKRSACKNLNESLCGGTANYSIEQQDELKVKIRISDRSKRSTRLPDQTPELPTCFIRLQHVQPDTPSRRSTRRTTEVVQFQIEAQQQMRTPRQSIVKQSTVGPKAAETPKRNNALQSKTIGSVRRSTRFSSISTVTSHDDNDDNDAGDDGDREFTPTTPSRAVSKRTTVASQKMAPATPKSTSKATKAQQISVATTPTNKYLQRQIRDGTMTPSLQKRPLLLNTDAPALRSDIQHIKESLHVSAVPQSLPCRETEFQNIQSFIERKILDGCGGCMYVSGVPGTGKTATVTEVIRTLRSRVRRRELPDFEYVAINGMKMTEPRQAYVEICRQLTGHKYSAEQAQKTLEHRFTQQTGSRMAKGSTVTTVLLVDELDILCNRRQDVVYNILDWPTKMASRLVVVTIANTMDLPERLLMGKVTSRLGLTRLTFQPYSHSQLQQVVMARLAGTDMFRGDAVQLVARKVASVSGDCRRALDICRRSIEIAEAAAGSGAAAAANSILVSMGHVQQAFTEMIASTKVLAIKGCSRMEQVFLQAVEAEVTRTGVEETSFMGVYTQFDSILRLMGMAVPPPGRAMLLSSRLAASKLIIAESARADIYQKILLNVSADDIHYALHAKM